MSEVCLREGETQDSLLRRFQKMVQMSGILREAKAHRHFVSKRDAAQIKAKNNARRRRRQRQPYTGVRRSVEINLTKEVGANIYVGNLSQGVTEEELRQLFMQFGQVVSVSIIKDKYSGQSRGFGFVEMPAKSEGEAAIAGLKGKTLQDRTIDVSEARPRSYSQGGGSRGGGRY